MQHKIKMLQMVTLAMEAKTKTANQTKGSCQTWKSRSLPNSKGSRPKMMPFLILE